MHLLFSPKFLVPKTLVAVAAELESRAYEAFIRTIVCRDGCKFFVGETIAKLIIKFLSNDLTKCPSRMNI